MCFGFCTLEQCHLLLGRCSLWRCSITNCYPYHLHPTCVIHFGYEVPAAQLTVPNKEKRIASKTKCHSVNLAPERKMNATGPTAPLTPSTMHRVLNVWRARLINNNTWEPVRRCWACWDGVYRYSQRYELHWIVGSIHVAKIDLKLHTCSNNRALCAEPCALPAMLLKSFALQR